MKRGEVEMEIEIDREREPNEPISLKTNLQDVPILPSLKTRLIQNPSELTNMPIKPQKKKKFGLFSLNDTLFKKNQDNQNSLLSFQQEPFSNRIDFDNFMESELLVSTSDAGTRGSTPRTQRSFKSLVDEDYTNYIKPLKVYYPKFKYNHYKATKQVGKEKEYQIGQSDNFISAIALSDNYKFDKENFKINKNYLERSDLDEIQMIMHDFDLKIEMVELELNKTLKVNSKLLYSYIEKNNNIENNVSNYVVKIKEKRIMRQSLNKKYTQNISTTLIKGKHRQNLLKIRDVLNMIKCLKNNIKKAMDIKNKEDKDNSIQELSFTVDEIKGQIKKIRSIEGCKKLKLLMDCDRIIVEFNDQNEEKLLAEITRILSNFFSICINFSENIDDEKENNNLKSNYNIDLELKDIESYDPNSLNRFFAKDNFKFSNEKNNFELLLSYSEDSQNKVPKIKRLLITFVDIIDICIKDNVDIFSIVASLEKIVKAQIMVIFDQLQKKEDLNKNELLYVLSNSYVCFLSNYNFILYLLQKNFGLNLKMFNSLTTFVNEEINKFILLLISSSVHEYIFSYETDKFFDGISVVKSSVDNFLKFREVDFYEFNKKLFEEFFTTCYDKDYKLVNEVLENESWTQKKEIDIKYQEILDTYVNTKTIQKDNPSNEENKEEENITNNSLEYLTINDTKLKATQITLTLIDYLNQQIIIYNKIDNQNLKNSLVNQIYKFLISILQRSRTLVLDKNSQSGSERVLTELEISCFSSHCVIFKQMLNYFLTKIPNEELESTFSKINNSCKDGMNELINDVSQKIIKEFDDLDFNNYPIFQDKDYNTHIKKFTRYKKLYEIMVVSFLKEDVIELFFEAFKNCLNKMNDIVKSKPNIEDDAMLKQFRGEMTYIKKVFKKFEIVPYEELYKIIEDISKNINPRKLPKRKKKAANEGE